MFCEISNLQKHSIVSIGHCFSALALVVSGSGLWVDTLRRMVLRRAPALSDRSVRQLNHPRCERETYRDTKLEVLFVTRCRCTDAESSGRRSGRVIA